MDKTFIFDYDDTLAWCEHDYCRAIIDFFTFTINRLGHRAPDVQSIMEMQSGFNKSGVEEKGFKMEIFPLSLVQAYQKICGEKGIKDIEGEKEAYAIGMRAFDENKYREQGLAEGAEETLEFLIQQRDELILLTKGDERVQRMKIEATQAWRYFRVDAINIVEKKDVETLMHAVGSRDKDSVWHVGNSVRSDVKPALDAGLKVIYIPCETWAYEREHSGLPEDKKERIWTFDKITGIRDNYHTLC